ncbi:hypothetical protein M3J09_002374 [Ascochyta lentis]
MNRLNLLVVIMEVTGHTSSSSAEVSYQPPAALLTSRKEDDPIISSYDEAKRRKPWFHDLCAKSNVSKQPKTRNSQRKEVVG